MNADNRLSKAELLEINPTPILTYRWPESDDVNSRLRTMILGAEQQSSGLRLSNSGGWHSQKNLQGSAAPELSQIIERIRVMVVELVHRTCHSPDPHLIDGWSIEAWANVNRYGHWNSPHCHQKTGAIWSGIYYVHTDGATEDLGNTRFLDQSQAPKEVRSSPDPYTRELVIQPEPGLMVLFPSSLYHFVEPYRGNDCRISIAFNLRHSDWTIPVYRNIYPVRPTIFHRATRKLRRAINSLLPTIARRSLDASGEHSSDGIPWYRCYQCGTRFQITTETARTSGRYCSLVCEAEAANNG